MDHPDRAVLVMSIKHRDPEYVRNARIVRAQVRQAWRLGDDVYCWRCKRVIDPADQFDVGHLHPDGGPGLDNLAPEHRRKSATCQGNRAAGGKLGAAMTNARRVDAAPRRSRGLLPWFEAATGFFWRPLQPPPTALQQFLPLNLETP